MKKMNLYFCFFCAEKRFYEILFLVLKNKIFLDLRREIEGLKEINCFFKLNFLLAWHEQ